MCEGTQKTRGKGLLRQTFWSICSRHRTPDEGCRLCATGRWQYDIVHRADSKVHARFPGLWSWWHNRPNSASRRFLRSVFPNLR